MAKSVPKVLTKSSSKTRTNKIVTNPNKVKMKMIWMMKTMTQV